MFALLFVVAPTSHAETVFSDWITTKTIQHEYLPDDYSGDVCTWGTWSIETDPSQYYPDPSQSEPHRICVYRSGSMFYAKFTRHYGSYPVVYTENKVAVAFSDNDLTTGVLTPASNFGDSLVTITPKGDYLYHGPNSSYGAENIYRIHNFRDYLTYDSGHRVYTLNAPAGVRDKLEYRDEPIDYKGYGISTNQKWLILGDNNKLVRYNLVTDEAVKIAQKSSNWQGAWPTPGVEPFISNDGQIAGLVGINNGFWVIQGNDRCFDSTDLKIYYPPVNNPDAMMSDCPTRNLQESIKDYNSPHSTGSVYFGKPSISVDNEQIRYWDFSRWHSISYRPQPLLQYLALGDSFASGEGDMTHGGANYLEGTNVAGDLSKGVPREQCHQSSRAYPMLLGYGMSLTYATDFRSVACAGAVKEDVLTQGSPSLTNPDYLGQSAPKFGFTLDKAPRLQGLTNANALQDEAREAFIPGRVQQVEFVKKTQPKVITVMIGGNDFQFGQELTSCLLEALYNPTGSCDLQNGTRKSATVNRIYHFYDELMDFYTKLKSASPDTKIYVLGYPKFLSEKTATCDDLLLSSVNQETRQAINSLTSYANATIRAAANDAGLTYLDIENSLTDHALCDSDPATAINGLNASIYHGVMTEYMKYKQGVHTHVEELGPQLGGAVDRAEEVAFLNTYLTARMLRGGVDTIKDPGLALEDATQELLHPNAVGHQLIYERLQGGLGSSLLYGIDCNAIVVCPSGDLVGSVDPAGYVAGSYEIEDTVYKNTPENISILGEESDGNVGAGRGVTIDFDASVLSSSGGEISSEPEVSIHSTPMLLGRMSSNGDGKYELRATIPAEIIAGWHTIHVTGSLSTGREYDLYRSVFVSGPEGDFDGDGIADQMDTCAFGKPSGIDADDDGIDDSCDMKITRGPQVSGNDYINSKPGGLLTRVGVHDALYEYDYSAGETGSLLSGTLRPRDTSQDFPRTSSTVKTSRDYASAKQNSRGLLSGRVLIVSLAVFAGAISIVVILLAKRR